MQQGGGGIPTPPSAFEKLCSISIDVLNVVSPLIQLIILVIAPVNFCVILRTSVVHPNLKFIMVVQAAIIWMGAAVQAIATGFKIVYQDPSVPVPALWVALASFCMTTMMMLGHVLLLERILATVMAHRYEQWRSPWFSVVWFFVLATINTSIAVRLYINYTGTSVTSWLTFVFDSTLMVASFFEIIAITKLGLYNHRKYAHSVFYRNAKRTLSERYQLSENVRTLRQLGPILTLHFIQMVGVIFYGVEIFSYPNQSLIAARLAANLYSSLFALTNLGILITVIGFHPALRNKARLLRCRFRRFVGCATVAPLNVDGSSRPSHHHHHQPSAGEVRGMEFPLRPMGETNVGIEMETHFRELEKCWAVPQSEIKGK